MKKSKLTKLTFQTKLTRQSWNSCHESLITQHEKKFTG